MNKGYVYCIGGDYGPVKVGYSVDPEKRLDSFQTGNSMELRVLAKRPGTQRDESAAHSALARARVRGEWFERFAALWYFGVVDPSDTPDESSFLRRRFNEQIEELSRRRLYDVERFFELRLEFSDVVGSARRVLQARAAGLSNDFLTERLAAVLWTVEVIDNELRWPSQRWQRWSELDEDKRASYVQELEREDDLFDLRLGLAA